MAFYEVYGAPAPYAAAAYGYSAPAPYAVPPMPAYGVGAGAVDELRCDLVMLCVNNDPRCPTQLHAAPLCRTNIQQATAAGGVWHCRTVFLTGFPNDVKERELNNMLRFMPGYEASQMNWKGGQVRWLDQHVCGPHCCAVMEPVHLLW